MDWHCSLSLSLKHTHTHTHTYHNLFGNEIEDTLLTSLLLQTVTTHRLHSALLSRQVVPQFVKWSQRSNRLCESAAVSELLACWHRWWPQCPLCRSVALCSYNGQRSRSYCLEVFVTPIAPILVTWTAPLPGWSAAGQLESTDYWRMCKRGRLLAASFSDLLGVLKRPLVFAVNSKH